MKEGWEYKKLGEVCTIERGGSPRPIKDYLTESPNGINWIKIGDAKEGAKYITSTEEKIKPEGIKKSRLVKKGDFLLSNSMSFGKPYILDVDGCIHDGWLVIRDVSCLFDKSFLYYYLGSPNMYAEFKRLAVGGVVNNLNSNLVKKVIVPIPPLSEQQHIVEELDLLSSIIEKKKAQLKELDNLAQSIFYEMFGDPIKNEKKWEIIPLGEGCKEIRYGTSKPACENGKYKYLRMGNLTIGGELDLSNLKTINISDEEIEKCIVRYGDILFNRTNSLDLIGKTCMFDLQEPMIIAGYIIRVRLKEYLNPRYIVSLFNMPSMKLLLKKIAKGAVNQANINSKELASISVQLPPIELQNSYFQKFEQIKMQKDLIKQSITEVETLFNSRMDYYFN